MMTIVRPRENVSRNLNQVAVQASGEAPPERGKSIEAPQNNQSACNASTKHEEIHRNTHFLILYGTHYRYSTRAAFKRNALRSMYSL